MTSKKYMQYIDKSHKEARYKRVHSILLHLCEVQGKTKQNYITVIKIQNIGLLGGRWVH